MNIVIKNIDSPNYDLFSFRKFIRVVKSCNIIPGVLCVVDGKLDSDFTNLL